MIELNQMRDALGSIALGSAQFYRAPASITLLGDQVEASQGFALCFASDRPIVVAIAPRADRIVRVNFVDERTTREFSLDAAPPDDGTWLAEIGRAVKALASLGIAASGAELALRAAFPSPAGIAHASALALAAGSEAQIEPLDLALALAREHGMHASALASVLGSRDHALLVDTRTDEATSVPFVFDRAALVLCDPHASSSASPALLALRVSECAEAVAILQTKLPKILTLRDVSLADFVRHGDMLTPTLKRRTRYVVTENVRVLQTVAAVRAQDAEAVGGRMNESHDSLRDDYEVSTPELDLLVAAARHQSGVFGARMTGTGRTSAMIALVARDALTTFRAGVSTAFRSTFGRDPAISEARTAECAGRIG